MELEIEIGDLKESAVRRLLLKAIRCEMNRSKPMHQRKGEKEIEAEDSDEATDDLDAELEDLANLSEEKRGKAAPIAMDDEDMSDEAIDKIAPPKPAKKAPKGKKK